VIQTTELVLTEKRVCNIQCMLSFLEPGLLVLSITWANNINDSLYELKVQSSGGATKPLYSNEIVPVTNLCVHGATYLPK
jgi:hypothetical protein